MNAGRIISITFPAQHWRREEPMPHRTDGRDEVPGLARQTGDRLELFMVACEQERHLHSLFRDVTTGRADVLNTIVIMRRASERLTAALKELDSAP